MKYFIYKITNIKNNRYLFGKKRSNDKSLKLKYASNKNLLNDLKEFGSNSFKKEVFKEFESESDMNIFFNDLKKNMKNDALSYIESYIMSESGKSNICIGKKKSVIKKYDGFNGDICIKDRYFYEINNYCKHDNFIINKNLFRKLYKSDNPIYCEKCIDEISVFAKPTNNDLNFLTHPKKHDPLYIKKYFPKVYAYINNIGIGEFDESLYLVKNNLVDKPDCPLCDKKVTYCHTKKRYNIYCNNHGEINKTSAGERELYDFICSIIPADEVIKRYIKNKLEIDIFIPKFKLGIEYNGLYWHSEIFKDRNYHKNKKEYFKENDINLIYIWDDDWNNKKEIIKSIISNKLGIISHLYARNTDIRIMKSCEISEFLEKNHIQGKIAGSVNLALFHNNEMVSVMNFSKSRAGKEGWELLRFCNKKNISVIGGAKKLFKYFINNYEGKIISYSDDDIFDGKLYISLGFDFTGHTGAGFWWSNNHNKFNRRNFQKWKLKGISDLSGDEIMRNNGFNKIWNSGNSRWIYINNFK